MREGGGEGGGEGGRGVIVTGIALSANSRS